MSWFLFLRKFDWRLFFVFMSLSVFGLISMLGMGPAIRTFFNRQIIFFAIAVFCVFLFSFFDYRIFKNHSVASIIIYLLTILLLAVSLLSRSVRGVNAWISLGSFKLEPSEFAKLAVIILLAKYFSYKHAEIYRIHHIIASGVYVAIPAFLVLIQPDLGSAFIFFMIWLFMLLAAGIKRKHLLIILLLVVILSSVAWFGFLKQYQKNRVISFLNPYLDPKGEGYSIIQSRIAIGSGMFWGNGFGHGTQSRFGFLPEAHTDFAFAAFAEQFGFAGIILLLILVLTLLFRVGKIGFRTGNNFAKLFSVGLIAFIFSHIMINAGMNLGLLPITGIPFPFLSYGGSSIVATAIGLGLMESIKGRS